MNRSRWMPVAFAAMFGGVLLVTGMSRAGNPAHAQTLSGGAPPQHWQVQVDNASPAGHTWSFNGYYRNRFQAHAGDTITFHVAANTNAFHTVALLPAAYTPEQGYPGFVFRDEDDSPAPLATVYFNSKPFFGAQPSTLCGRGDNPPCTFDGSSALKSGVLLNPPPPGAVPGAGNPSFSVALDPALAPGTYFFLCLVHGPGMSGSLDVLPAGEPAQGADILQADASRQYTADLQSLTDLALPLQTPSVIGNPDGTSTWTLAAGGGSPSPRLSIDEFGVRDLIIRPGDTVTWENQSPAVVAHTVTGFSGRAAGPPARLDPFRPVCGGPDPDQNGETAPDEFIPPGGGFAPDIWNDCPPWQQEDHLTDFALPSAPSGRSYTDGTLTSGLLLPAAFLASPAGLGLPFSSTYSVVFPNGGTYRYSCMIHDGMAATIDVVPVSIPGT